MTKQQVQDSKSHVTGLWTTKEIDFLKQHGTQEAIKELDRTPNAVWGMTHRLKIVKEKKTKVKLTQVTKFLPEEELKNIMDGFAKKGIDVTLKQKGDKVAIFREMFDCKSNKLHLG